MSVPDPVTTVVTAVAAAALNQVAKQAEDFIAAVTGHKGESIGTILGSIAERRRKNAETASGNAYLTLLNIGVNPGEIPLKVLQRSLEGASLEEEPAMQDVWANMLANAGDPRQINPVHAIFPELLKGLTSREVRFLQCLFMAGPNSGGSFQGSIHAFHHQYQASKLPPNTIPHYQGPPNLSPQEMIEFEIMIDILTRMRILKENVGSTEGPYSFTALGREFVRACQRPKKT
jgi:hypothetical protein